MGQPLYQPRLDRAAYFAWEDQQSTRNEYLAGEVYAMVGARREHVLVAGMLFARFRSHLKGTPCQAFVADMKLEIDSADAVFYPDVMVSCDAADRRADLALRAPCLLVEVLSDSTAAFDRGAKFVAYRQLASLNEYLVVDIDARRLELFRREPAGWTLHDTTAEQPHLHLASIALDLAVAEVFEDLTDDTPNDGAATA